MKTELNELKKQLRQECKQIRASLREDTRLQANTTICHTIEGWKLFKDSDTVLTYMPMRGEVDLSSLLEHHPSKQWAIPRILPEGQMVFHAYDPTRLVRHPYGMLEPASDCPTVAPDAIQLALVPGLAYDSQGWRLGYGGGFYDRFLSSFSSAFAGVTYQALLLNHIPHAGHDIPMQFVITETGMIECLPRRD